MSKIFILINCLVIILPLSAIDNFSFSLYNQVANSTNGNIIISPISAKIGKIF